MLHTIQLPELKTETEGHNQATFAIEPLYSGYGMTLGNSLRRVILSSLGGAAVSAVKIDGVSHEFSTMPGITEDVVAIVLNLKKLRFRVFNDEVQTITLTKKGKGPVTGADITTNADIEVVNGDQHIATIDDAKTTLSMEIRVEKGRGYVPVEARQHESLEVGMIAVDSLYSPVRRVRYNVENTRVGQQTDFDRLLVDIETDGSITPHDAISQAAKILVEHFAVVAGEPVSKTAPVTEDVAVVDSVGGKIMIEEVNFSPRTANALINNEIRTIADLTRLTDSDLKELKGFGAKAYDEVKEKLAELEVDQDEAL